MRSNVVRSRTFSATSADKFASPPDVMYMLPLLLLLSSSSSSSSSMSSSSSSSSHEPFLPVTTARKNVVRSPASKPRGHHSSSSSPAPGTYTYPSARRIGTMDASLLALVLRGIGIEAETSTMGANVSVSGSGTSFVNMYDVWQTHSGLIGFFSKRSISDTCSGAHSTSLAAHSSRRFSMFSLSFFETCRGRCSVVSHDESVVSFKSPLR